MDRAPFRFPGPVLGTMAIFALLLVLDWLSLKFPGPSDPADPEKDANGDQAPKQQRRRRRFVDPVMMVLAPPCDFLLRNMSVLFTPAFVLIPAREVIPGREIGILAAWFVATQIVGFVLPVLICWGMEWLWGVPSRVQRLRQRKLAESRRNSTLTLGGLGYEKRKAYGGGDRLGPIATGLSGLTAVVVAPVSHIDMTDKKEQDGQRHVAGVELERARQQGEPLPEYMNQLRSDVSSFRHPHHHSRDRSHHHHHHRHHLHQHRSDDAAPQILRRSVSAHPVSRVHPSLAGQRSQRPGTAPSRSRPSSAGRTASGQGDAVRGRRARSQERRPVMSKAAVSGSHDSPFNPTFTFASSRSTTAPVVPSLLSHTVDPLSSGKDERNQVEEDTVEVVTQSPTSVEDVQKKGLLAGEAVEGAEVDKSVGDQKAAAAATTTGMVTDDDDSSDDEEAAEGDMADNTTHEPDAIERLADWISDLLTPFLYFALFIVGIPLWFLYDFALALHLSINILTFWLAITVVPAKIRRYAHPILTTAIATVLIIWAFGAMRGQSLKQTLSYYDRDAKFDVLWAPSGYTGPVPGAADVLSSLLDAGIVALFVPLYRYRKDLQECGIRIFVALLPCCALSLFVYPTIGSLIGLDQIRALAFVARFLSTPLAIELIQTLRGDESITVILVVITGILAAILKEPFFKMMRVSMDDHLTVGVTFGATSGAIGASSLIARPRVMAVASLGFVMFGAINLIAVAIPPLADAVRMLATV